MWLSNRRGFNESHVNIFISYTVSSTIFPTSRLGGFDFDISDYCDPFETLENCLDNKRHMCAFFFGSSWRLSCRSHFRSTWCGGYLLGFIKNVTEIDGFWAAFWKTFRVAPIFFDVFARLYLTLEGLPFYKLVFFLVLGRGPKFSLIYDIYI